MSTPLTFPLLRAQSELYAESKRWRTFRVSLSVALALAAPVALVGYDAHLGLLAALGAIWAGIAQLLGRLQEGTLIENGARVQEAYDTETFGLPWNRAICGSPPEPEFVRRWGVRSRLPDERFQDWYIDASQLPRAMGVLLRQRQNLSWDIEMRRRYAWCVGLLTTAAVLGGMVVAILRERSALEYVLIVLLPSLSAYVHGINTVLEHLRAARAKESARTLLREMWTDGLGRAGAVGESRLRQLQDRIFVLRSTQPPVPDWFYRRYRDEMHDESSDAADRMRKEAETLRTSAGRDA